jgi:hypothetical protein
MNEYRGSSDKTRSCYRTLVQYSDSGCNKIIPPAPVTQVPKILQMFQPHPYSPPSCNSLKSCNNTLSCNCNNSSGGGCPSQSCGSCGSWCGEPKNRCDHNPLSSCSKQQQNEAPLVENYGSFSIAASVRPPYNCGKEKLIGAS